MAFGIDIALRAEGLLVELAFGALIDNGPPLAGEWAAIGIGLEEVLADFWPHFLQQETDMTEDRVIAQDSMVRLDQVTNAKCGERSRNQEWFPQKIEPMRQQDHGSPE